LPNNDDRDGEDEDCSILEDVNPIGGPGRETSLQVAVMVSCQTNPFWGFSKKEGFLLQLQKRVCGLVCGHPCIRLSTPHIFIPSMEAVGAVASVIAIVTLAQELVALGHELKQSLDKASCAICDQRKTESTLIAPCTRYRLQFVANPLMLRSTSSTLLNSLNPSSEIVGQTSMRPDCMTHCPL